MRAIKNYVVGLVLVFVSYFVGEGITQLTSLPVPGALVGLLLLFALLLSFPYFEASVTSFASKPLAHMSLFFVPAVMGVTLYWQDISNNVVAITTAILVTTIVSLLITALIAQRLLSQKVKNAANDNACSDGLRND